jgi:hypothetical protein
MESPREHPLFTHLLHHAKFALSSFLRNCIQARGCKEHQITRLMRFDTKNLPRLSIQVDPSMKDQW